MTFSIITVTYNAAKWIERTLQSVASQTCKDFEYIVVDGKSADRTLEIIKNSQFSILNSQLIS
jgi:glycosyltransferase involved in cell wall biosynthesis